MLQTCLIASSILFLNMKHEMCNISSYIWGHALRAT